ncbi:hypothetical protein [Aneurinibacillus tyrosinisolvens]|uniref:hypothetical protein n=1 Tax=Aneurinibacillus tyrosinisolvens TaxID=1443435 RepID=UPI00063F8174|nr:hypothetical protein [Aneurinibacillus tyrosinisolvens]
MKKYQIYFILFCIMVGWGFNVVATKVLAENYFLAVGLTKTTASNGRVCFHSAQRYARLGCC